MPRGGLKTAPGARGKEGAEGKYIALIHKWPIYPISALREKFNPRNMPHMPAAKFFMRLDLEQI